MSIPATCPGCKASYLLAETMLGKKVRCKSCAEVFVICGQTLASDCDEVAERIQTSLSPAKRAVLDKDDEDVGPPRPRRSPFKKRGSGAVVPLLIVACIFLGFLVLALGGVAVWALARPRQPQPIFVPPLVQAPVPPINPWAIPPPPMVPPAQEPLPAPGPVAVKLTNANISGFGAQMEVTADYRFTSGNPAGRRIFLLMKATKAMGFLHKQSFYVAELHSFGNKTQGTIQVAGMTFGIENGPFEMWLGEGPAGIVPPLISDRDLTKISNVVTVAAKQPGMPGFPGMGPPPGFPGARPPIGPRGIQP